MLRQIESGVQNGPITKNALLPLTTSFFWKFNLSIRSLINSWFNIPIAQTYILMFFVNVSVLFEGLFSLWVSLSFQDTLPIFTELSDFHKRIIKVLKMKYKRNSPKEIQNRGYKRFDEVKFQTELKGELNENFTTIVLEIYLYQR